MRKKTRRKHLPAIHPMDLLQAAKPLDPSRVLTIMVKIHDAFAHIRGGGQDTDLFDRIAVVLNVGLIRSEQIGQAGVDLFKQGQAALMDAVRIKEKHGRYGLTGPALEVLRECIALYEEILSASSALQMARAQNEVMRRIAAGEVYCPEALAVEAR